MKYKSVKVELELLVVDDQPVEDWLPAAILEILNMGDYTGEALISYKDDEPVVKKIESSFPELMMED